MRVGLEIGIGFHACEQGLQAGDEFAFVPGLRTHGAVVRGAAVAEFDDAREDLALVGRVAARDLDEARNEVVARLSSVSMLLQASRIWLRSKTRPLYCASA